MTKIKQKYPQNSSLFSIALKVFDITFFVLFLPTACLWVVTFFDCTFCSLPNNPQLLHSGQYLGLCLVILGLLSAIVIILFVVYVLGRYDTLSTSVQTVLMIGGVLVVFFIASASLQNIVLLG